MEILQPKQEIQNKANREYSDTTFQVDFTT